MDLRQLESRRVQALVELFHRAGQHVPASRQDWKPAEGGKSALEMVEHVIGANEDLAALIRGQTPTSAQDRQAVKAQATDYPQALEALQASAATLAEAIASVPPEQLTQERKMPWGETWPMTRLLTMPGAHIAYHWGQLCYLQTLWDDQTDYF